MQEGIQEKPWRCVIATHDAIVNAIREERVLEVATCDEAENWLKTIGKPAMIYHKDAAMLQNTSFAMAENDLYRAEYQKALAQSRARKAAGDCNV